MPGERLTIQSVGQALANLASLGNWLEMQFPGPLPPLISICIFYKIPRCFSGIFKFQQHGGRHLGFKNAWGREEFINQCAMLNSKGVSYIVLEEGVFFMHFKFL